VIGKGRKLHQLDHELHRNTLHPSISAQPSPHRQVLCTFVRSCQHPQQWGISLFATAIGFLNPNYIKYDWEKGVNVRNTDTYEIGNIHFRELQRRRISLY